MFWMLKQLIGAFCFRFWTKRLPPHPRKPGKNTALKTPSRSEVATVRTCWDACERYVMLACVALGLLQLVALKYGNEIWRDFRLYLRTPGRAVPSEATTRMVLARAIQRDFRNVAPHATMAEIQLAMGNATHPPQSQEHQAPAV